ncbi:DUF4426 domain-containing protein [Microbulbifer yueqingensis]|uniref:DUF4426 domain-containing protein n=1 Tax=Microbulbifer yueqingensis TaxID=658219 RepID=UPI000B80F036|nr:DUF4426 domain-containing protein [Microbulbifer yueqingensis]
MKRILSAVAAAALLFWAASAAAVQEAKIIKSHQDFGDYRVFYSVFNSEFIKPEIARNYQLIRGKDRAFVNVSVVKKDGSKGLPAEMSGTATNLMQQSRPLKFQEVRDGDAIYYLAPLRFDDEETLTFDVNVTLPDGRTENITFRRRLERD